MLASVRKALVPLVVTALAVVLDAIGVKIPGDALQQIAFGIVNSALVYLFKNE